MTEEKDEEEHCDCGCHFNQLTVVDRYDPCCECWEWERRQ